jgi:hypothetical protein
VHPGGWGDGKITRLSVFLEAQDDMWVPSAEYKFTVVNQVDGTKSRSEGQSHSGSHAVVAFALRCFKQHLT